MPLQWRYQLLHSLEEGCRKRGSECECGLDFSENKMTPSHGKARRGRGVGVGCGGE